ncbi:MAG: mycofactocin-coupled SDR family oxidoreductase [Ilumatobacteraceae bacterium]
MAGRVDGKVALITGAARGQGRAHAVRLASEGADIVAIDICKQIESNPYPLATPEDLAETARMVESTGRACVAVEADVRERPALVAAAQQGIDRLGRLDIVVANAGILPTGAGKGAGAFLDAIDVDLVGVMNTVAVALPHLPDGASVVITGSTAGMMPGTTDNPALGPGGAGYNFAKKMLLPYVEALALQLAPRFIRVNGVHPTNTNTHLLHHDDLYRVFRPDLESPTRADAEPAFVYFQAMPIPYIEPEDMADLVLFLASEESKYITGHHIRVDAGSLLKIPGSTR